jgi:phosphinothricin acetyltransferase
VPPIAPLEPHHGAEVLSIYRDGIETGLATLETEVPGWETWDAAHCPRPRLVAFQDDAVAGFAALSPVSRRAAYAGVGEVSIYVAARCRGRGVGRALLSELVARSEDEGFWTLQAGILAVNGASRALHRACGFREVGVRERIGRLHGVWHDVVLMERRSARIPGDPSAT